MSHLKTSCNARVAELIFVKMMILFDVNRIIITSSMNCSIEATVGWPNQGQSHYDEEEEQQEVIWSYQDLNPDVSWVIEHLRTAKLIRGDRIEIAQDLLKQDLSNIFDWSQERAGSAIEALLGVRIEMIDDGTKADAFFVHF